MSACEPRPELPCGIVGCRAVERHQRVWHSRDADDVGAPSVRSDGSHLDQIWTSCNRLFKSMHGGAHLCKSATDSGVRERFGLYVRADGKQAKPDAKAHRQLE